MAGKTKKVQSKAKVGVRPTRGQRTVTVEVAPVAAAAPVADVAPVAAIHCVAPDMRTDMINQIQVEGSGRTNTFGIEYPVANPRMGTAFNKLSIMLAGLRGVGIYAHKLYHNSQLPHYAALDTRGKLSRVQHKCEHCSTKPEYVCFGCSMLCFPKNIYVCSACRQTHALRMPLQGCYDNTGDADADAVAATLAAATSDMEDGVE